MGLGGREPKVWKSHHKDAVFKRLAFPGWIREATNTSRTVVAAFVKLSGDRQAEYAPIKFSETTVMTSVQHPP